VSANRTIVVHVGDAKAGTTYIQHLLYANPEALQGANVVYPSVDTGCNEAHHFFAAWLCKCNPFDVKQKQPTLSAAEDGNGIGKQGAAARTSELSRLLADGKEDVVLSSETFYNIPMSAVRTMQATLSLHATRIKVVLFYREKKSGLVSLFKQQIQAGDTRQWDDALFERQLSTEGGGFFATWKERLDDYIAVFGRENVVLVDYAGLVSSGMDPAEALLHAGTLPFVNFTAPPDYDNPSIDDDEVAARQLWAELASTAQDDAEIGCSSLNFSSVSDKGTYLFNFSSLQLASWGHPKRCANLARHDQSAMKADTMVRSLYGDLLMHGNAAAAADAISKSNQLCELDVQAVRDNRATWLPRFKQQLEALPGACVR